MRKGAVPMMNHEAELVYAGVDTYADTHHVAVIGAHGRELGDVQVPATAAGSSKLSAPATIPATTAPTFAEACAPADPGTLRSSSAREPSPARCASAITGTRPAVD